MNFTIDTFLNDREILRRNFLAVRSKTETLVEGLSAEDMLLSATLDTSPPKWHLAHTSWFFDKFILRRFGGGEENQEYDFLFNSYYKAVGVYLKKSQRSLISRPSLEEIKNWRLQVTSSVDQLIQTVSAEIFPQVARLIEVGINHEQQHQELLYMDIKRNFFENPSRPRFEAAGLSQVKGSSEATWQNVPSQLVKIGHPKNSPHFAYDNEGDSHYHWVDSFMLSSHLVTNGEYLSFIQDGGYDNPLYWLSDGWEKKEEEGWRYPLYWEEKEGSFWHMTLAGMMPLDLNAPVGHVSFYEAKAYAQWKGARLPTEFEWEAAASKEPIKGHFMESTCHEPRPAQEDFENFSQLHGTLWEWTQSAYLPYPRYESFDQGLSEYNEKFMCNQFVLRGGSCVTPLSHYRLTYRNFYYPHNRWQFSGIRLAKDLL